MKSPTVKRPLGLYIGVDLKSAQPPWAAEWSLP